MEKGRLLVPFRNIFEALGGSVQWDSSTKTLKASKSNMDIDIQVDTFSAKINNNQIPLDVPAKIINSRTFVPLRFILENLGARVERDDITKTASVWTK